MKLLLSALALFVCAFGSTAFAQQPHQWRGMTAGAYAPDSFAAQCANHVRSLGNSEFTNESCAQAMQMIQAGECKRVSRRVGHVHDSMSVVVDGRSIIQGSTQKLHDGDALFCPMWNGVDTGIYFYSGTERHCNNVAVDLPKYPPKEEKGWGGVMNVGPRTYYQPHLNFCNCVESEARSFTMPGSDLKPADNW